MPDNQFIITMVSMSLAVGFIGFIFGYYRGKINGKEEQAKHFMYRSIIDHVQNGRPIPLCYTKAEIINARDYGRTIGIIIEIEQDIKLEVIDGGRK
jgi:hypothetical protein